MDELDRGRELLVPRPAVAEQRGAAERQHRAHALTASGDQVSRQLRNQGDLALHAVEDDGIHAMHVVRDERHQRLERWSGRTFDFEDGRGHGRPLAVHIRFS